MGSGERSRNKNVELFRSWVLNECLQITPDFCFKETTAGYSQAHGAQGKSFFPTCLRVEWNPVVILKWCNKQERERMTINHGEGKKKGERQFNPRSSSMPVTTHFSQIPFHQQEGVRFICKWSGFLSVIIFVPNIQTSHRVHRLRLGSGGLGVSPAPHRPPSAALCCPRKRRRRPPGS